MSSFVAGCSYSERKFCEDETPINFNFNMLSSADAKSAKQAANTTLRAVNELTSSRYV